MLKKSCSLFYSLTRRFHRTAFSVSLSHQTAFSVSMTLLIKRHPQFFFSVFPKSSNPNFLFSIFDSFTSSKLFLPVMEAAGKLSTVIMMVLIATITHTSVSADPDMLQDVCVADLNSPVKINGFDCKPIFNTSDFFFGGLASSGNTSNLMGSNVTAANVLQIPGLNTLGVSMARIDYAPKGGLNPPHTHPRATEIVYVLYGELEVGFITTANVLVSKSIKQGDVFVFPKGLVHFQQNNGESSATVIASFNSQFPGVQVIAQSLFAATPPVMDGVLSRAFQINNQEVDQITSRLSSPMS